jgi:hypothetical protein
MKTRKTLLGIIGCGLAFAMSSVTLASDHTSSSPPFWTFAAPPPSGETRLVRSPQGLTAQFKTTGLSAGHAVTLWIMFFDNPEACMVPGFCNPETDIGRPGVRFDFHYAGGHIVNGRNTTISGHLQVGETSTSGWAELVEFGAAPPFFIAPLTNPSGAQVILALHSHGPAQTGQTLAEQMSSYLGGCILPFLGDAAGFAQSSADIPASLGECSTIQVAFHFP